MGSCFAVDCKGQTDCTAHINGMHITAEHVTLFLGKAKIVPAGSASAACLLTDSEPMWLWVTSLTAHMQAFAHRWCAVHLVALRLL